VHRTNASRARRGWLVAALIALTATVATACETTPPPAQPIGPAMTAFNLLNQFRARSGLPKLSYVPELGAKAQAQAQRMANERKISHSANLAAGVPAGWRRVGENVAMSGSIQTAQTALENSPEHRANMLNRAYNQVGVAVVNANGAFWVVQELVQR
jgi:uncharacterized protein YkwD